MSENPIPKTITPRDALRCVLLVMGKAKGEEWQAWDEIVGPDVPMNTDTLLAIVRDVLERTAPLFEESPEDVQGLVDRASADGLATHVMIFGREHDGARSRMQVATIHNAPEPDDVAEALWLALERIVTVEGGSTTSIPVEVR